MTLTTCFTATASIPNIRYPYPIKYRPIQSSPGKILTDSVFSHRTGNLVMYF